MRKRIVFHPLTVLCVSLLSTAVFAYLLFALFGSLRYALFFYYNMPIGVPFVAYLFDRIERRHEFNTRQWALEVPLVLLALMRAFYPLPLISGHAVFLAYTMLTTRSIVARMTAMLIMLEVAYLKIFEWHDRTIVGGILLGVIGAIAFHWLQTKSRVILAEAIHEYEHHH